MGKSATLPLKVFPSAGISPKCHVQHTPKVWVSEGTLGDAVPRSLWVLLKTLASTSQLGGSELLLCSSRVSPSLHHSARRALGAVPPSPAFPFIRTLRIIPSDESSETALRWQGAMQG